MREEKGSILYRIIRFLVWLFTPRFRVEGAERLPDEPVILVGNHSQMYGPIVAELYMPRPRYTWCIGEMMDRREVPAYAFRDFWSYKPKRTHWFYKILSHLIAPLSQLIFTNARTIPVYHDARLVTTFRTTMQRLDEGSDVVIFPEHYQECNEIIYDFQDRFIDVARMYYRRTGKALCFVPMYICPKLKKVVFGDPIRFDPEAKFSEERGRICAALMQAVTALGVSQPRHRVIPYRNIRKRDYPYNRPDTEPKKPRFRKPVVDYREFRLSKLNEPRFSHLKLLAGWIGYFCMYFLTENLIPAESCHVMHCWVDDLIPFCEYFVVAYTGWYVLVVGSLLFFLLYDIENFKGLQKYIIITQVIAMAVYIIYPSRQDLRPETFAHDNIFTWVVGIIYAFDTPTGVCPSLHVAYSVGIASAFLKTREAKPGTKAFIIACVVLVFLSIHFVKQHSFIDALAAVPVCFIAEAIAFQPYWHEKRLKLQHM